MTSTMFKTKVKLRGAVLNIADVISMIKKVINNGKLWSIFFDKNIEICTPAKYVKSFEKLRVRDMVDRCLAMCFNLCYVMTPTMKYQ